MEIFYGKITAQIDEYRYKVKRMDGVGRAEANLAYAGTVLSAVPTSRGAAFKAAAPETFSHLNVVCAEYGPGVCYILGFTPIGAGGVVAGDGRKTTENEKGGFVIAAADNTHVKGYADGSLGMYTDAYSQMVMEPRSQSLFAQFRSMIMKWWTGKILVTTIGNKAALDFYFAKELDLTALPTHKMDTKPDSIKVSIGDIENTKSILKFKVEERFDMTGKPDFKLFGNLGVDKGDAFGMKSESTSLKTTSWIVWKEGGALEHHIDDQLNKNKITTTIDTASASHVKITAEGSGDGKKFELVLGTGANVLSLSVGEDKCSLIIDKDGNVTIKTAVDAKIKLGGTGAEQQLLTKSYHDMWASQHVHGTSAPGAPTTPPILPVIVPLTIDSATAPWTNTVKAE